MGRNTTFRVGAIALVGLLISLMAVGARAQQRSSTGLQPLLPIVPPTSPRPLESEDESLSKEQRGPLAEFLDSATTSDAVLEVIVGQSRLLTTKGPIAQEGGIALVATGDPTVVDFEVAGPRLLRILGFKVGVTDLSITTDVGDTYTIDVHVVYDLPLLTAYLQQIYPDAQIELRQLREHIVLQGQARSVEQISQIVQTLTVFLRSAQVGKQVSGRLPRGGEPVPEGAPAGAPQAAPADPQFIPTEEPVPEEIPAAPSPIDVPGQPPRVRATIVPPQVINLMRVPGVQQVMLKVQIAELNRTAFRNIGADIFVNVGDSNLGSQIAGGLGVLDLTPDGINQFFQGAGTTAYGVFDNGDVFVFLHALRTNGVINVLAEPNLVALNGQEARFQAGGEFPVPVPQAFGVNTIEYKEFGVLLNFVPTILDDETIRLRVAPEVSSIGALIPIEGFGTVPSFVTRNVNTTVELKQGQTLALAGLLQIDLDANTNRIPGLGDLPYLGPFFSNTRHQRVEKELLVMVTPYLVSPMAPCQAPPMPGSEILDPKCCEFYLMNRIEGRTGQPYRSTTAWDDPCYLRYMLNFEQQQYCGPIGYSE